MPLNGQIGKSGRTLPFPNVRGTAAKSCVCKSNRWQCGRSPVWWTIISTGCNPAGRDAWQIKKISRKLGITSIFVTHDQIEAMSLSDEVFVLNQGRVEQYGSPQEIYNCPDSRFVARFIGKSNWIENNMMFRPETVSLEPISEADVYEAKPSLISSF